MPRFSICISVFNGERYLRACIDSVLNQSFSDYELIIVDDASSDVLRRFSKSTPKTIRESRLFAKAKTKACTLGIGPQ